MRYLTELLIYTALALLVGAVIGELGAEILYHVNNPAIGRHLP